jgi:hypothetical protein
MALTRAFRLFLARWARNLSGKETARGLPHFLGPGVPEYVVGWGLVNPQVSFLLAVKNLHQKGCTL